MKSSETIRANLHLPDGSVVQFHEPIPGEIAIVTQTPINPSDNRSGMVNGVDPKDLEGLDLLEIYSILSGGLQAPTALIEAQQRMVEQARQGGMDAWPERSPEKIPPDVVPAPDRSTGEMSPAPEAEALTSYPVGSGTGFARTTASGARTSVTATSTGPATAP